MQKYMLIFTTACCFIFAGINLLLNYHLYNLIQAQSYEVKFADASELTDSETAENTAVFSNGVPELAMNQTGGGSSPDLMLNHTASYDGAVLPGDITNNENAATLAEAPPLYLLGMKDGYITVFYGSGGGTIVKEVTALPAGALPFDEQLRLSQGIPVYDEGQLIKLLQDYGS